MSESAVNFLNVLMLSRCFTSFGDVILGSDYICRMADIASHTICTIEATTIKKEFKLALFIKKIGLFSITVISRILQNLFDCNLLSLIIIDYSDSFKQTKGTNNRSIL